RGGGGGGGGGAGGKPGAHRARLASKRWHPARRGAGFQPFSSPRLCSGTRGREAPLPGPDAKRSFAACVPKPGFGDEGGGAVASDPPTPGPPPPRPGRGGPDPGLSPPPPPAPPPPPPPPP